jgi:hypothetical protein
MDLDDPRWANLQGGYRLSCDPRDTLRALEGGAVIDAWTWLWENLHHQGDVGEASYATIPELVRIHERRGVPDWNTYALAATIEEVRYEPDNPPMPTWLAKDYDQAWRRLFELGLAELPAATDENLVCSILAVLAHAKGQRRLGAIAMLTEDERQEMLGEWPTFGEPQRPA